MNDVVSTLSDVFPASTQRIAELVDRFIASQDVKACSKQLYRRTLKQYFLWVDEKGYMLSEIARPQILEYKNQLLLSGRSSLTVGSYLTSVKRFYEWTEANKLYPNIAKGIKSPKRKQQQPLLPIQATALLDHFKDSGL
jgi:site-specific recombinase XerD